MQAQQARVTSLCQRVHVDVETSREANRVKICLESHDEGLGWYTAASLSIPLAQVPLLQQALEHSFSEPAAGEATPDNIIPFPQPFRQPEH